MNQADQKALEKLIHEISKEFLELFDDDKSPYEYNTHENCAEFLYVVCERAKIRLPHLSIGLLTKRNDENGYTWISGIKTSHDTIAIPNGERFDIISAAGDINERPKPTFNVIPKENWRAHNVWIKHTDIMSNIPIPKPNPDKPSYEELGGDNAGSKYGILMMYLEFDYERAGQKINSGSGVWFFRTWYDSYYGGLSLEKSIQKHRAEWCVVLNVPVIPMPGVNI